jgi:hypothetical protein
MLELIDMVNVDSKDGVDMGGLALVGRNRFVFRRVYGFGCSMQYLWKRRRSCSLWVVQYGAWRLCHDQIKYPVMKLA